MKKRYAAFLAAAFAAAALSGCGKAKFEPEASSIYVKKDGTVVSADIESFEGENYSEDELKTYVEDAVKLYNSEQGAEASAHAEKGETLPVEVESLKVEDGVASLFLNYETCEDYMEFTGTAGMEEGIADMEKSTVGAMSLEGSFKNADGEDVPLADVQEKEDYHVVEVDGPVTMQIEGKVQFISSGVTVDSKNTVTTPAGEVSYIVFK